jgi:RNA polymerase sigma-70 factor (ECF subfamily)
MNQYAALNDRELLRLCRDDELAFDALYTRHWQQLYQYAYHILRDGAACMDVVQDVFVSLWERRERIEIDSPGAYLRAAVKFRIANYIRAGKVREDFWNKASLPEEGNPVEEGLDLKELQAIVRQVVLDLPERCGEIYRLSRQEHLTNQQIADRLGISVKAVERQMSIALRRIRSVVEAFLLGLLFFGDKFHS